MRLVEAFLSERSVSSALDAAKSADIAFVGVGTYGDSSSAAIIDAMTLSAADRAELDAMSPAGDICARYFDINGSPSGFGRGSRPRDRRRSRRPAPRADGGGGDQRPGQGPRPGRRTARRASRRTRSVTRAAARAALALDTATPRPGTEGIIMNNADVHLGFSLRCGWLPDAAELAAGQAIHGRRRGAATMRRRVHRPR